VSTLKQKLGALYFDVPRALRTSKVSSLNKEVLPWVNMHNRGQSLLSAPGGPGVK